VKTSTTGEYEEWVVREIGNRIEFFRKARGITLEELASSISVSRSSISNVEKGRHRLDIVKLLKVAKRLDVGLLDIVPEDNSSITNLRYADREHLSAIRGHVAALRISERAEDADPGRLDRTKALVANIPKSAFVEKKAKAKS